MKNIVYYIAGAITLVYLFVVIPKYVPMLPENPLMLMAGILITFSMNLFMWKVFKDKKYGKDTNIIKETTLFQKVIILSTLLATILATSSELLRTRNTNFSSFAFAFFTSFLLQRYVRNIKNN